MPNGTMFEYGLPRLANPASNDQSGLRSLLPRLSPLWPCKWSAGHSEPTDDIFRARSKGCSVDEQQRPLLRLRLSSSSGVGQCERFYEGKLSWTC